MPIKRRLLRESITYSQAKDKETNVLHQLTLWQRQNEFFNHIHRCSKLIEDQVTRHLGSPSGTCQIADQKEWMHGSFNLCVPVSVLNSRPVLMRFPLPYRIGDESFAGNGDEKVRCEAGAYTWLQQEAPTVRIAHLHGFGLSNGKYFISQEHLSFFSRLRQRLRCWVLSIFGFAVPSRFVPYESTAVKQLGPYMLLEYVQDGEMLSNTWNIKQADKTLRSNLFRGLCRIMLSLSRTPLPYIGSHIIDDSGFLRLVNRPLTLMLQDLENAKIPVNMSRNQMFSSVDSYVNALLSCHDNRLKLQPNAVKSGGDCASQMTALALMRTIRPHFFDQNLNNGPFIFSLTDLHASNILVDKDWNIRCLLDLEWAASLPIEFMQTPDWLTSQAVDMIDPEGYNAIREEFMAIFEEEEKNYPATYELRRADILKMGWDRGTFWYTLALQSPTGLHALFYNRIRPPYSEEHEGNPNFFIIVCQYWVCNARNFIKAKLKDKETYDDELRAQFEQLCDKNR